MSVESKEIQVQGEKPICISFSSPISPSSACVLQASMGNAVNDGHDEIHLFLSTPGGSVREGISIYNFARALSVPIVAYNIGSVDSIGNVVFQAAGRRVAATASSFMFHGVGFDAQNTRFELKSLQKRMQSIENDQSLISDIENRTGWFVTPI